MSHPPDQPASDAMASIILIAATLAALLFVNTGFTAAYHSLLSVPVEVRFADLDIAKPLILWINDGLMAIFFFLVGLEIKSEFMEGALASRTRAMLPAVAAIGGMLLPALIYAGLTFEDRTALHGWAIPAATDIAFAVGILGLLGKRVPPELKAFLLALAVLDDLGAIIIIALFYTAQLSLASLLLALLFIGVLAAMNRFGVMRAAAYILVGVALWVCVLKSGVHATLAGVAAAIFVPIRHANGRDGPLHQILGDLQWPVTFGILPLFAFANAGVPLAGLGIESLTSPVTLGIILGLVVGKPVGIMLSAFLAVRFGAARLPAGIGWRHILGAGCLGGIGFTMSLFIGTLAFESSAAMDTVRVGVLVGSLISAALGIAMLTATSRRVEPQN